MTKKERDELRRAVADYMWSEGCSCCQNVVEHKKHTKILAEFLGVPAHPNDPEFFDFSEFRTEAPHA